MDSVICNWIGKPQKRVRQIDGTDGANVSTKDAAPTSSRPPNMIRRQSQSSTSLRFKSHDKALGPRTFLVNLSKNQRVELQTARMRCCTSLRTKSDVCGNRDLVYSTRSLVCYAKIGPVIGHLETRFFSALIAWEEDNLTRRHEQFGH
jgi:hypothetical protein